MSTDARSCPHCQAPMDSGPGDGAASRTCPACGRSVDEAIATPEAAGPLPTRTAGRRGGRNVAVLAVTLVVLAGAGGSIAWSLSQADWFRPGEWIRARGRAAPAAGVGGPAVAVTPPVPRPEEPSERCELRIYRAAAADDPIVLLSAPGMQTEFHPGYHGAKSRLAREIVRQAVLMAARDRMNLPVRDAVVGDPSPAFGPSQVLEVDTLCRPAETGIAICRELKGGRSVLLDKALRIGGETQADYITLLKGAEACVRDELPKVLAGAGLDPRPGPAASADDRLPGDVEIRLRKMVFVEAFAAARQLHEAIRKDGPSPRRIQGLVRAYANLGLLTEHQWDGASRAYKARGLLYAQSLVAAEPGSPVARWYRAYATALAGLYRAAIDDLEEARKLAEAKRPAARPAPPGWVPLVDALCRYDYRALDEARARGGPDDELAAMFYLLSVEQPARSGIALRAARSVLDSSPECFRAYAILCEGGGISALHFATTAAPEALSKRIPRRIATLPGVPAPARQAAERPDEVAMTGALDDAAMADDDRAEPSWSALARMVRENRFLFTFRRLYFMAVQWSVPTDEYWDGARLLVAEHRFRPLLEAFVSSEDGPDLRAFADKMDTTDLDMSAAPLIKVVYDATGPGKIGLFGIRELQSDWTVRDLGLSVDNYREPPVSDDRARKLIAISPNSPFAMARLMEDAWDQADPHLEEWRKVVGDHPTFLGGMARHLVKAGKADEAEKTLERYIRISADKWAYEELAKLYLRRGDGSRWKATLDEFLARGEDYGLDHAEVRVAIANELMKVGKYAEARPYADAAAQTWAGWAMSCAQQCAEAQEDWEAAEAYAQASSERYPATMWAVWFLFCERNGEGDVAAARAWTRAMCDGFLQSPGLPDDSLLLIAYVELLCGEKAKAREALRRFPVEVDDLVYLASLAATADLAGLPEPRDAALRRFCDKFQGTAPKSTEIMKMIQKAIADRSPGKLDLAAVDKILDSIPKARKGNSAFSVAAHLTAAGRLDDARRYWTMVAQGRDSNYWWQTFALSTLRNRYPRGGDGRAAGEKKGPAAKKGA